MQKFALIALMFMSLNGFAQDADYSCDLSSYRLNVNLTADKSTSMELIDLNNRRLVAQGYAKAIQKTGDKSHYFFYPGNAEPMKLTFKTQDALDFPETIHGRIETKVNGILLWEKMECFKQH
jgi:hypothetical protein